MRQKWIDNAKGLAMICIILGHVNSGNLGGVLNFHWVYGFHLAVFFLLSGYTLKKKTLNAEYLNGKFKRLMIPYFITCTVVTVMDIWNCIFWKQDGSIATITEVIGKDLIRSFFASGTVKTFAAIEIGTRIGAIWFLPAIFFAVVIMQWLLQRTESSAVLGTATAVIALVGYISARFIWLPFSIQSAMMGTFFIWIGYELKRNGLLEKIKWYYYLLALGFFAIGVRYDYVSVCFVSAGMNDLIISVLVALAGSLLVYGLASHMEWSRIISAIGRNSVTVLCVHLVILETMGQYFSRLWDHFSLTGLKRNCAWFLFELLAALTVSACLIGLRKIWRKNAETFYKNIKYKSLNGTRDMSIDIAKGIFILFMLVGHFAVDATFRSIIYSCHMIAFVFFSGYFYKKSTNIGKSIKHIVKTLLFPYILFVFAHVLINCRNISAEYLLNTFKQYLAGMSFSQRILTDVPSVGPVYFILMLLMIRLIYLLLDHVIRNEKIKLFAVLGISCFGMKLGQIGFWLPWSIDIACYALIFYQIGICFKKYDLLQKIKNCHIGYFFLVIVWAYMIYNGSMEIAIRSYGQYGLVVIGSVCGVLLIYKLSSYVCNALPLTGNVLACIGKHTIYILIIHTLLGSCIKQLVSLRFDDAYIYHMILSVLLQVMTAIVIGSGVSFIIKMCRQLCGREL